MNRYRITHRTHYEYAQPVALSHNECHLLPLENEHQLCESARLRILPQPQTRAERRDYFGNRVHYFALEKAHRKIEIVAESVVQRAVTARVPLDEAAQAVAAQNSPAWESAREAAAGPELARFAYASPLIPDTAFDTPALQEFVAPSFPTGRPLLEAAIDFNQRIFDSFEYDSGFSIIGTPLAKVLKHRKGVCQDFAHLFLAGLRSLGLAARYVSGYLETKPPPGRPKLAGADASHAWVSVWIPGSGDLPGGTWMDLDPTNRILAGNQHIVLACGRDYSDVTPLKGVIFGGGKHEVQVAVDVVPLNEQDEQDNKDEQE